MEHRFSQFNSEHFAAKYHYDGPLGALYTQNETTFRLWAPTASSVVLALFKKGDGGKATLHPMEPGEQGTWSIVLAGDWHGAYYLYQVTVDELTKEAVDPYAKAVGLNGQRGMVVDLDRTNPEGWESTERPPLASAADAVIYEMHVRDFSIHKNSGILHKGKYLGMVEPGTKGPKDTATGLDHLLELGITHLQLMPTFDFFTVDESKPEKAQYNWGYDPHHHSVPEGSYATDPKKGEVRIAEFKTMVQKLHEAGIRVIMDVVYNHTYLYEASHLNHAVPGYYYRQDPYGEFADGSGCGNELASERSMVRRYILDSVLHWAREYKIDGFRFDLMGLHDLETMNDIRQALDAVDPSLLLFGEGWTGGWSPLPDGQKAIKGNTSQMPGIGVFNDDLRDGIKGHVFHDRQRGFISGGVGMDESVKFGVVGAIKHPDLNYQRVFYVREPWAVEPTQSINYCEAHDNLTLWDKLTASVPHESEKERIKMHKLAAAILLTGQGIPFLHGGMEFLRTKNGDHNSFQSSDAVNRIDWARKPRYQEVYDYYRGLIALRRSHPALRMASANLVQRHLEFLLAGNEHVVGFHISNHANEDAWKDIVVAYNAHEESQAISLPYAQWVVVVNGETAGTEKLGEIDDDVLYIPGRSCVVLADKNSLYL